MSRGEWDESLVSLHTDTLFSSSCQDIGKERNTMEIVYWTFKGIQAVFYVAVILYLLGRWKSERRR